MVILRTVGMWFFLRLGLEAKPFIRQVENLISNLDLLPIRQLTLRGLAKIRPWARRLDLGIAPAVILLAYFLLMWSRRVPYLEVKRAFLRNGFILPVVLILVFLFLIQINSQWDVLNDLVLILSHDLALLGLIEVVTEQFRLFLLLLPYQVQHLLWYGNYRVVNVVVFGGRRD